MDMRSNVEIKARVRDLEALRRRVEAAASGPAELLEQEDEFFDAPAGRLKLRVLAPDRGELIHYHRADAGGPRESRYRIAPTADPEALRAILRDVLPGAGTVRKRRLLYLLGQTRVHLDRVEGLGDFVELEVVLRPGQPAEEGRRIAAELMERLGIAQAALVGVSYVDLLAAGADGASR